MWRTEWSIFCHEIRTKECPFKHAGSTYKIKLQKKNMFNLRATGYHGKQNHA